MFEETLKSIVANAEGAVGALIMGIDGIAVARATASGASVDLDGVAAEYTTLLRKATRNTEGAALGQLRELVVAAEEFAYLIKPITSEYFLVLVLAAPEGLGRARFELRKAQLALEEEFSL
jgi:predicted regulator of Ras-like GTPase activity (Roadblock/LC7/MglB family)